MRIKNLIYNFKIFLLFGKLSAKTAFQSRLGSFLFILTKLLRFLIFLVFIYFIAQKTNGLAGYSPDQAVFIYLTFNIADTLAQVLFREVYRFKPMVVSGELNNVLIKPYHPLLRVLIGGVDFFDVIMLIFYLGLTILQVSKFSSISLTGILLYIFLILNGVLIAAAFHIFVLAATVVTAQTDQLIMIYRNLTATGRFPLTIYRPAIRIFFTFVIPVGLMIEYPARAMFNALSWINITIAVIFSFLILKLSLKAWRFSLAKYQSWGG